MSHPVDMSQSGASASVSNSWLPGGMSLFSQGASDHFGTLLDNGLVAALLAGGGVAAARNILNQIKGVKKKHRVYEPPTEGSRNDLDPTIPIFSTPVKASEGILDIFKPRTDVSLVDMIAERPTAFGAWLPAMLLSGGLGYAGVNKAVNIYDDMARKRDLEKARQEFRKMLAMSNQIPTVVNKAASISDDMDDLEVLSFVIDHAYDELADSKQLDELEKSADIGSALSNVGKWPGLLWASLLALSLYTGAASGYKSYKDTIRKRMAESGSLRGNLGLEPRFVATPVDSLDDSESTVKASRDRTWGEWWSGQSYEDMAGDFLRNNPGAISDIWAGLDPRTKSQILQNLQTTAPEIFRSLNVGQMIQQNPEMVNQIVQSLDPQVRQQLIQQFAPDMMNNENIGSMMNSYLMGENGQIDMSKVDALMNQLPESTRNQLQQGYMDRYMGQNPMMSAFNNVQKWFNSPDPFGQFVQGAQNAGQGWWNQTADMLRGLGSFGASLGDRVGQMTGLGANNQTSEIGKLTPPVTAASSAATASTPNTPSTASVSPIQLPKEMKTSFA